MPLDPITGLYALLLIGNLVVIFVSLFTGQKLKRLCRVALIITRIAFLLTLIPLVYVLIDMRTSSEAGLALPAGLCVPIPVLLEYLALAALCRWRMNTSAPPP
jgi:hypothetical protein